MKRQSQRSSDNKYLLRLAGFVVGVLAVGMLLPQFFSTVASVVVYPAQVVQSWWQQTTLSVPLLWKEKNILQAEIDRLNIEIADQGNKLSSFKSVQDENRKLRDLLGNSSAPRIMASVVTRPDQLPYDLLQLDQGSNAGVEVGAPVYVGDGTVVGLVSRVYSRSSLVTLFTTPGFSTTAYLDEADVLVKLEGMGAGVARVLVPQGILLEKDQLVFLPSVQPGLFGKVVNVENQPTQPQQYGYITNDIPLQHMRFVFVGQAAEVQVDVESVETYLSEIQNRMLLPDVLVPEIIVATSTATSSAATSTVLAEEPS